MHGGMAALSQQHDYYTARLAEKEKAAIVQDAQDRKKAARQEAKDAHLARAAKDLGIRQKPTSTNAKRGRLRTDDEDDDGGGDDDDNDDDDDDGDGDDDDDNT